MPLPSPYDTDGFALPGCRWAGPGWDGPALTRPVDEFDFAAKLHDLGYVVNDVTWDADYARDPMRASRRSKLNDMFLTHIKATRTSNLMSWLYKWKAWWVLKVDKRLHREDDGFRNVLQDPELALPYLMIPFQVLSDADKHALRFTQPPKFKSSWTTWRGYSCDLTRALPGDNDWRAWAQRRWGSLFAKLCAY